MRTADSFNMLNILQWTSLVAPSDQNFHSKVQDWSSVTVIFAIDGTQNDNTDGTNCPIVMSFFVNDPLKIITGKRHH